MASSPVFGSAMGSDRKLRQLWGIELLSGEEITHECGNIAKLKNKENIGRYNGGIIRKELLQHSFTIVVKDLFSPTPWNNKIKSDYIQKKNFIAKE